jgi:endonuclease I
MRYRVVLMRPASVSIVLLLLAAVTSAQPPDGYYDSASGLTGTALRSALHEIIDDHTRLPYTSSQPDTWDAIHLADEAPGDAARILDLYRNRTFLKADHWSSSNTSGWNREHSWPKSYGFTDDGDCNYPYTDVHHLFASDPDYNEARGNIPFDWAPPGSEAFPVDGLGFANYRWGQYENGAWEVWPMKRGDLARAMFYMDVRYEGGKHGVTGCSEPDLRLTSERSDFVWSGSQNLSVAYMGILSTLLEWHLEDPPDERERRRNDVVFQFQGNRNPFIDHPEFVCEIYACALPPDTEAPEVPIVFAIHADKRSITIDWHVSSAPDFAGYRVYRRSGGAGYEQVTSTAAVTFTDTTVVAGTEYGFAVSAMDESGNESAMSREVRSSAGLHLRAFVTRSSGVSRVTLEWSGPETETVDVWRNGVHVSTTANDSTWTDEAPGERGVYEVCESGTNECTNQARIALANRRRGTRP